MWIILTLSLMAAQAEPAVTAATDTAPPQQTISEVQTPKPPVEQLSWRSGDARLFVSSTVDGGYVYLRPRLTFGYGKPHYKWAGIDLNPIFSNFGAGVWGGARLALPYIDVRAGARAFYSFRHSFLDPQDSFDRESLETSSGDHAKYTTFEVEANSGIATPIGELGLLGSVSSVRNVPEDKYVFEEVLRVIVAHDAVLRGRASFGFYPLAGYHQFTIGPAVDVIDVPSRNEVLVRAGIVTRIVFNRSIEVRGNFLPTVVSRDRLGLITSDFTELGIRYRWATD